MMTGAARPCGAWGGCQLPAGHNRGKVDIPENHARPAAEPTVETWADEWDVRPLIEARLRRAAADALRDAATATLSMTYPTSADPDVWGAWLLERAEAIEAEIVVSSPEVASAHD